MIAAQQTRCITADTRHMTLLAGIYGSASGVRRTHRETAAAQHEGNASKGQRIETDWWRVVVDLHVAV
jgi:hypothetical protein